MFGHKKSTDKCYTNEQTFECYNICSYPIVDKQWLDKLWSSYTT